MLRDHPTGNYRFIPGITAFSSGVIAMPGHQIVHATLGAVLPWRAGFALIDKHLKEQGRGRTALCGIELRSPKPYTFDGFAKFNEGYRALLGEWGILVGDDNPIPPTNVAPVCVPPGEPSLYAFAGEMGDRTQGADGIVRKGETSPEAMKEKARFVMGIMQERMRTLSADWTRATTIDVYTAQPIFGFLEDILKPAGPAAIHGLRWFPSRPPIEGLEFEVDLRGVARELVL